jgi:plasmid stabilization system protein ParE
MAYEVIWSVEAEYSFEKIVQYLELVWSDSEISKFINEANRTISILSKKPHLFKQSEKNGVHQVMIGKQNMLLYDVNERDKRIELLSFWDARKSPSSKFSGKIK